MTKQRLELTWYNKDMALIPTEVGKYGYTWVDPSDPRYCETHTLVMDEYVQGKQTPKSDGFEYSERADLTPQDDNLLILGESGDVLEALTRVPELADKYVGKVKLIYIDPPFNTAQTFVSYEDNLEHSIWLTMMRDRLLHMRKLLSDDGSIWVHLDDVENHRMRLLMDEIFGLQSFIGDVQWQKSDTLRNDSGGFSRDLDSIVGYSKSSQWNPNREARPAALNKNYSSPDRDPNPWFNPGPTAPGAATHQGMVYAIQNPMTGELHYPLQNRHWALSQDDILRCLSEYAPMRLEVLDDSVKRADICGVDVAQVRSDVPAIVIDCSLEEAQQSAAARHNAGHWPIFHFASDGKGYPAKKSYIPKDGVSPRTFWSHESAGSNRTSKQEIKALFPGSTPFSTPKPERLLERIIHIGSNPGDIVLDVFAGSGTTAAVAQKMGRRWVTCELLKDTFSTFTRPRLEKVINDQDPGGITRTKGERVAADDVELPEGVSPDDAAKFTSVLNKLIADEPAVKKSSLVKALKAASKTKRTKEVINWRGGGGFQVAHLSPACFDVDEELGKVVLTGAATGQTLIDSVTANLGFHLLHPDDDVVFEGRKGRTLLKVHEGIVDEDNALTWLGELQGGESLVIAALGVADGVNRALRRFGKGCRAIVIPDDLFCFDAGEES
jgi:putative DNA restriction-modification system, DNA methylase